MEWAAEAERSLTTPSLCPHPQRGHQHPPISQSQGLSIALSEQMTDRNDDNPPPRAFHGDYEHAEIPADYATSLPTRPPPRAGAVQSGYAAESPLQRTFCLHFNPTTVTETLLKLKSRLKDAQPNSYDFPETEGKMSPLLENFSFSASPSLLPALPRLAPPRAHQKYPRRARSGPSWPTPPSPPRGETGRTSRSGCVP